MKFKEKMWNLMYLSCINPLWIDLSISGTREQPFTEIVGYLPNISTKITKGAMVVTSHIFYKFLHSVHQSLI